LRTPLIIHIISFLLSFVITMTIQNMVMGMITRAEFVRPNFKQNLIPVGSGIIFPTTLVVAYIPLFLLWPQHLSEKAFIFIFVVTFAALLGILDDFWGSKETSGLKGHLGVLFKGRLTTGGFKAVWGGILALLVAVVSGELIMIPVNALLLALSINAINLLDLRPGRAGKAFIFSAVLLAAAGIGRQETVFLAVLTGSFLAFFPLDLKAKTMMGDAGSNALGGALGIMSVWLLSMEAKFAVLLFLVAFHLITEKVSLTKIIEKNSFLNFLDKLGRER